MTINIFSFVIYMIHACANKWKQTPSEVYDKLQKVSCINKYLVPNYEVLHTQSSDYVVQDIEEYMAVRGITI